jgi:hypothetical protein
MATVKIKGDTSGEISLTVPGVAGANTLTLPASTGNVIADDGSGNVAISGRLTGALVGFYAYDSSTVLPTSTTTTVVFSTEGYDTNNAYDTSTGRFTAPVSGYYFLHANVRVSLGSGGNSRFDCTFYINGTGSGGGGMNQQNANDNSSMATHVLYLTAGQYVELKANQNSGASQTCSSGNNAGGHPVNHFTGYLIGT